jgi:hypothetical protein
MVQIRQIIADHSTRVFVDQILQEHQPKQQYQGGQINAAEIWHETPDGAQQWFRQSVNGIIYLAYNIVGIVENVECHQPAHHNHDDDDPENDKDDLIEQPDK